jgi:protein phosphatase
MATTLTVWLDVWPYAYLLQVGDSRCYILRDGKLSQISRDQTVVQDLVDAGVLTQSQAMRSPLSHVLSSAIGGQEAAPVITRFEQTWDQVGLLCSDGLTKHVSDERIAEVLRTMTSARQACETLLQEALDAGGSDNITIVIGRPTPAKVDHPLLHTPVK